ncbi:HK97 gp10 family phage protein [Brevibacillus choshinensis]|uniref:HK97-gp10 family putative phage morphogenesis protein n=1 Tax=Brevibacillus choshinensis TaxID=54911 RepID=UPI002E1DF82A|nr:HK97 gp10 family phage protein [Brevibacillus choshinensis]
MAKLEVRGLAELTRKIAAMSPEMEKQIQKQIVTTAGKVRNAAKSRVPVRSGKLKKAIRVKYEKGKLAASIGPRGKNAWYAHFVEFGTAAHATGKGSNLKRQKQHGRIHPGSDAQPFLVPAWEQERPQYIADMTKLVRDVVKR